MTQTRRQVPIQGETYWPQFMEAQRKLREYEEKFVTKAEYHTAQSEIGRLRRALDLKSAECQKLANTLGATRDRMRNLQAVLDLRGKATQ